MQTIGIDIGASAHVVAVCRPRSQEAKRGVLRIRQDRADFAELDGWLARQGEISLIEAKYFAKRRLQRVRAQAIRPRRSSSRRPSSAAPRLSEVRRGKVCGREERVPKYSARARRRYTVRRETPARHGTHGSRQSAAAEGGPPGAHLRAGHGAVGA